MSATFSAAAVMLISNSSLQIQRIDYIVIIVGAFWGTVSLVLYAFYDIRLRKNLGSKYYNNLFGIQMRGMIWFGVTFVLSAILGFIIGWLVMTFDDLMMRLFLSLIVGSIYGGVIGILLDFATDT